MESRTAHKEFTIIESESTSRSYNFNSFVASPGNSRTGSRFDLRESNYSRNNSKEELPIAF